MEDYWAKRYREEGMIWGSEPSPTVYQAIEMFRSQHVRTVYVPGSGYGRNTKALSPHFQVEGMECSPEAIRIAAEWDPDTTFIEGSVLDIKEDDPTYDAIYCFDLLHLFLEADRRTFIQHCTQRLKPSGLVYVTCFSDEDRNNGVGRQIEEGTYAYKPDKYAHFFSEADLRQSFGELEIMETGFTTETLSYPDGRTQVYALRYIVAKKRD